MNKYLILFLCLMFASELLIAQCESDRHSTDAVEGWISCNKSQNPKTIYGNSHWVQFDLGSQRSLYDLHVWNINHPDYLDDGIKNLLIDVSSNGSSWTTVDTFTFSRANGSGFYTGSAGPDLAGINARYLLLTALDNHGGGCVGLSELKIYTQDYTPPEFELNLTICQDDGIYQNLSGGRGPGSYSGVGVADNGDGTFDFDAFVAGPGVHELFYQHGGQTESVMVEVLSCESPICNGCLDCPLYDQMVVNLDPVPEGTYYGHELNSEGQIDNEPVIFYGGSSVNLLAGFEIESSGVFEADIRACYSNLLSNPGFESDQDNWSFSTNNGAVATINFPGNNAYAGNKSARINVTQSGEYNSSVRLRYQNLSLEAGRTYTASFYARSGAPTRIFEFRIIGSAAPYTSFLRENLELKDHWKKYTVEYTATETRTGDVFLDFRCGEENGAYFFDQVTWAEVR